MSESAREEGEEGARIPVDEAGGREEEVRRGRRSGWRHPLREVSEEEKRRTEEMMSSQLQDSTRKMYATYVGKFVMFLAMTDPSLFSAELYEELNKSDVVNFWRKGREFYLREPRPKTPMIDLERVPEYYPDFVRWMHDNPEMDMSDEGFGNVRSAVKSLYRAYRVPSEEFDIAAREATGGVERSTQLQRHEGKCE